MDLKLPELPESSWNGNSTSDFMGRPFKWTDKDMGEHAYLAAQRAWDAQQAVIDRLMLEFCPDEMSAGQTAAWATHQRAVPESRPAYKHQANAGPSPGDMPVDRFVSSLPLPTYPPVPTATGQQKHAGHQHAVPDDLEFREWFNHANFGLGNPYTPGTQLYWLWAGWNGASLQPAPVAEPEFGLQVEMTGKGAHVRIFGEAGLLVVDQFHESPATEDHFKEAYMEWSDKTNWVQEQQDSFPFRTLGIHRADIMRQEIERLRAVVAAPVAAAVAQGDAKPWTLTHYHDMADIRDGDGDLIATMYGKPAIAVVEAHNATVVQGNALSQQEALELPESDCETKRNGVTVVRYYSDLKMVAYGDSRYQQGCATGFEEGKRLAHEQACAVTHSLMAERDASFQQGRAAGIEEAANVVASTITWGVNPSAATTMLCNAIRALVNTGAA